MGAYGWMETFWQDIRLAVRGLRKSPGFLTVVVLSLALGIGANTTIFSMLNALLYRPLPYPNPNQLTVIWQTEKEHPADWQPPPIAELADWKKQATVFQDIALTSFTEEVIMSRSGEPEPGRVQYVTPNFFSLLGVQPILGRIFTAEEMQDHSYAVVISKTFWKNHFNNDPQILGKTLDVDSVPSTVVGVMPAGFAPFYGGRLDLWIPVNPESARYSARIDHWLMPVGRLKPGTTVEQAQVEMDVIAKRLEAAYPKTNKGVGKLVRSLHRDLYLWAGQALYPLLGAVACVLLIACVNVANLMRSRTETRRKEYSVRAALGASRRRLMQQLFAESGILAVLGGGVGILLAYWGIQILRKLLGEDFPNVDSISIDGRVLLFTLAVSVLTAGIFGLAPALQASNPDVNATLREGEGRTVAGSRGIARHVLAVSEVALAMVLLVGAGLMINTILRLQQVNPGFDPRNLLTMYVQLPEGGKYLQRLPGGDMEKTLPTVAAFNQELTEKIAALPGIASSGIMSFIPMRGAHMFSFSVLGHPAPALENRPRAGYDDVSPTIFQTLHIPLKKGRYLDEHDTQTAPWAVVVNEAFARKYFPDEDPIGQQILLRFDPYPVDEERPRQIVGVVGDVKHFGLGQEAPPFMYASYLQQQAVFPGGTAIPHLHHYVVIRRALGSAGNELAHDVKTTIAGIDPDLPVTDVRTMEDVISLSMGDYRVYTQLLGVFAGVAAMLAAIGIYGVMSYFVSERTREIGIRVALGAERGDVLRLVATLGLKLAVLGVAVGLALAFGLTRFIATFLYGVKATDPVTYTIVAVALIGVALVACYVPARRALKVDPIIALRYE
ncbi:MAG TPA: ABC transporter permease [Candidatus Methylomirabilis sp.]|nr:ABC transporter permease [Candidatus Methylomirabilis sp.]